MTMSMAGVSRRNPFATRHTRPGRLVPRDAGGAPLDLAALLARASDLRAAAIEGPHGAGKTNLLVTLAGLFAQAGRHAGTLRPRSWRDGPAALRAVHRAAPGATLCIDSWEALGRPWAVIVRWAARRRRVGLLVTSHAATGLPVLVRCETSASLLSRLVAELPEHLGLIGPADVERAFGARRGDIREALYDLYDRFERRVRGG
ncbi:MAG: hypothetical protein ACKOSQ_06420 [Planctomycetaceae bacterium]